MFRRNLLILPTFQSMFLKGVSKVPQGLHTRVHFLGSILSDSKWELMWVAFDHIKLENQYKNQIEAIFRCRQVFKVLQSNSSSKNLTIFSKSIFTHFYLQLFEHLVIFELRVVDLDNRNGFMKIW